jgi:hypothetical protein
MRCPMKYFQGLLSLAALMCSSFLCDQAGAQFVQQGNKLVGTGAVGNAYQGYSVSLSSDGNTAMVGGSADNSNAGAAWVFTRSAGAWSQQGTKLVGTGAVGKAKQGSSVSLSADGNTALVGGEADNTSVGAAWVFTRTGGVWSQQGDKLVGTDVVGSFGILQGGSVSLSADGNTALVGGIGDNKSAGAAWVFVRNGGVWTQQGAKLVGTGTVGSAFQGCSVSLSADGNTAIVGGYMDSNYTGAAWVYTRSNGVWAQQGSKLAGLDAVGTSYQGASVWLSSDGNTAIVGGSKDNAYAGAVWVYSRSGGVWTQQGSKLVGTGAVGGAFQGISVSLSGDGNTAIAGGLYDNTNAGAVWVFTRSASVWSQCGDKLVGVGAVGGAYQGYSVSLSSDGNTAIVGGYRDSSYAGAAWVYTQGGTAVEEPKLEVPHQLSLDQNYPNPFNPSTTIRYELPKSSMVRLSVYNILAREVSVLVNERKNAGAYEVRFDASGLASGVYFYRMQVGNFVQTKKLVLLH